MTEAESNDSQQIAITLPDGSVRELPSGSSVLDLAASIGAGLAKATLGGRVSGHEGVVDLRTPLVEDCEVSIITSRDDDGLAVVRHSASHIMADAICRLWPISFKPRNAMLQQGNQDQRDNRHQFDQDVQGRS